MARPGARCASFVHDRSECKCHMTVQPFHFVFGPGSCCQNQQCNSTGSGMPLTCCLIRHSLSTHGCHTCTHKCTMPVTCLAPATCSLTCRRAWVPAKVRQSMPKVTLSACICSAGSFRPLAPARAPQAALYPHAQVRPIVLFFGRIFGNATP